MDGGDGMGGLSWVIGLLRAPSVLIIYSNNMFHKVLFSEFKIVGQCF